MMNTYSQVKTVESSQISSSPNFPPIKEEPDFFEEEAEFKVDHVIYPNNETTSSETKALDDCAYISGKKDNHSNENDAEEIRNRRRAIKAERERSRRQKIMMIAKGGKVEGVTEEEKLQILQKLERRREHDKLRQRRRRENMTAAQREAIKETVRIRERERRKELNESQLERRREYNNLEQRENPEKKRKTAAEPETLKEKWLIRERERKKELSESQLERRREYNKLKQRERHEEIRRTAAGHEALKEKWRIRERERRKHLSDSELKKVREIAKNRMRQRRKEIKQALQEYKEISDEPLVWEGKKEDLCKIKCQKDKEKFANLVRSLTMTEEEKKEMRIKRYFSHQSWKAKLSEEEWAKVKEKRNMWHKRWASKLTGEKKQRHKESVKRAVKKCLAKKKEWLKMNPELAKSENEKRKCVRSREVYNKLLEYQRKATANETPEERLRRLHKYKVNAAKRKLRKELSDTGLSNAEIDRKVNALGEKLWAEFEVDRAAEGGISEYKPRPRGRKPKKVVADDTNNIVNINNQNDGNGENLNAKVTKSKYINAILGNTLRSEEVLKRSINTDGCLPSFSPNKNAPYKVELATCRSPVFNSCGDDYFEPNSPLGEDDWCFDNTTLPTSSSPSPNLKPAKLDTPVLVLPQFICERCSPSGSFPTEEDLRTHIRLSHFSNYWKCPICKQVMLSSQELSVHFKTAHAPPQQHQPNSSEKTVQHPTSSNLVSNLNPGVSAKPVVPSPVHKYICMKCPVNLINNKLQSFKNREWLLRHVQLNHIDSFWPCRKCKLLKYSKESLEVHKTICYK